MERFAFPLLNENEAAIIASKHIFEGYVAVFEQLRIHIRQ